MLEEKRMKIDIKEMVKEALYEALDELLDETKIEGKTLREWIEIFSDAIPDEGDGEPHDGQ